MRLDSEAPAPATTSDAASPWAKFAGITTFAALVAISPLVASKTFTPTYAVVLVVAAVGFVPFLRTLTWSRKSLASWALLGFVLVGLVSSLTSVAPNISIFGLYLWGTGWLLWFSCAGAYGIGMRLSGKADLSWLTGGIIAGAIANALLALYQTLAMPTSLTFGPYQGNQADGFLGNPVDLEALILGSIALVALRATRSRQAMVRWLPVLVLFSVALEFTEERLAVLLLPLIFIGLIWWRRLRGAIVSAAVTLGYGIGYLGAGRALGGRLSAGTSSVGFGERLMVWRAAFHAILSHPIIGFGPGLFEAATAPRMTARLSRDLGPIFLFSDAHDVFIEVAVTTGLVGLVLFATWLVSAGIGSRNHLAFFAVLILAVECVEPISLMVTPFAFLAFGAAQQRSDRQLRAEPAPAPLRPLERLVSAALVALALLVGGTMLAGDYYLAKAPPYGYVLTASEKADRLLPYWPESASGLGTMYEYFAATTHVPAAEKRDLEKARPYFVEATRRDPFDPLEFAALGSLDLRLGLFGEARVAYLHALRNDPWSPSALAGLGAVDAEAHRWRSALSLFEEAVSVTKSAWVHSRLERALHDIESHIGSQRS